MKLRQHVGSLLFVALACASAVYAAIDGRSHRSSAGQNEPRVFPELDKNSIVKIEVERGPERLTLERARSEESFRMLSPAKSAVDPATIDQLVSALELATIARPVPDAAPSASPRARVTVAYRGKTLRFALAEPAPVPDGAAYLDLEDGRRVVVRRELVAELLRPFDAYRDRMLVAIAPGDVKRIEARAPSGVLVAEREGDASFRVVGGGRIARDVIERWLGALPELRATTFVQGAGATDPSPWIELTVVAKSGQRADVRFFRTCPGDDREVLATSGPPASINACVPRSVAAAFDVTVASLVDRRLFTLRADEVSELGLTGATSTLGLARTGSGFRERLPDSRDLDAAESEVAAEILATILATEGAIASAPATPPAPAVRISVVRAGGETTERVDVVDLAGTSFAHRLADDAWLSLAPAARRALEPGPGGVKAPWLLPRSLSVDALSKLTVKCPTETTIVRGDGGLALESPRGAPVDTARAIDLIELLARARGRAVAFAPEAGGSEACLATLAWSADGGAVESTIRIGSLGDAGSGVVARRDDERLALALGDGLREALAEPLVDRAALAFGGDGPERATVSRAGKPVAMDATAESGLRAALARLRATRVERVGPALPAEGFGAPTFEIRASAADASAPVVVRLVARDGSFLVRKSGLDVTFRIASDALPLNP